MRKFISKHQKKLVLLSKWGIFILSTWYIYYQVFQKRDFPTQIEAYGERMIDAYAWVLFVLLLMPLNWFLDAYKWKRLLKNTHTISSRRAFKAIFSGVTVSILTPNRIGEFAGRIMFLPSEKRVRGATLSIVASVAQLIVTFIVGGGALIFTYWMFDQFALWMVVLSALLMVLSWLIYFHLSRFGKILKALLKHPWTQNAGEAILSLSKRELREAFVWSSMRYLVFSLQLALLLAFMVDFSNDFPLRQLAFVVPTYFLFQTIVPTIALSEIGARGMVLSFLLGSFALESDLIFTSTLLWVINIILPAAIGSIVILINKIKLQ